MLRNILIFFALIIMLSGCLPDLSKYSTAEEPSKPVIDVNTGKVLNMWIPREMRMIESWEYIARGEERMCSEGYYIGKYINKQHLHKNIHTKNTTTMETKFGLIIIITITQHLQSK